jgi:hypothetical protein
MTVQEPVEETLEDVTETLEEELAYEAGDLDEQIEAEAEAQNEEAEEEILLEDELPPVFGDEQLGSPVTAAQEENDVETTEETTEVLETEEAEVTPSVPVTAGPGQRIINVLR